MFRRHERLVGLLRTMKSRKVNTGVERPYPEPRTLSRRLRSYALVLGSALTLASIYAATCQLQLRAEPLAAPRACTLETRLPFYVGFAPGGGLETFEPAAIASRGIVRAVRLWLCDAQQGAAKQTASLRGALLGRRALRAEQLQFDDVPLSRAHVVLAELTQGEPRERGWHVHVARSPEGWSVSRAKDQRLASQAPLRKQ